MGIDREKIELKETAGKSTKDSGRHLLSASLMLVVLSMIWGLTFPLTKAALDQTNPIHFLTIRFFIASAVLTPWYFFFQRKRILPNQQSRYKGKLRSVWTRGGIIGSLLFLGFLLQVIGMNYTTASRSGFFTGLLVVMVPPLAAVFRTSRVSWINWIGLLPAVAGVYLLAHPESGGFNKGDFLTLLCAFTFAAQMIVLEVLGRDEPDSWALTLAQIYTIFIGAFIWTVVQGNPIVLASEGWIGAIYTGIFGSIFAVWLQTRFQPVVPASHAALIFTLEPVFAALFAVWLLGDSWTMMSIMGALLILSSMIASSLGIAKAGKKK